MTDLVRDLAADVRPPEFDTLVRRAGRRRVRRRASVVLAAAAATSAVAVGVATLQPSAPRSNPTQPSPSPTGSPTATSTSGPTNDLTSVASTGTLLDYAVDGHGDLLTRWQSCRPAPNDSACAYALKLSYPDGSSTLLPDRWEETIRGSRDGFVRASWDGNTSVLTGTARGFTPVLSRPGGRFREGTVLAAASDKLALLAVDPATTTSWPITADCVAHQVGWSASTVSSTGVAWAIPMLATTQEALAADRPGPTELCTSMDGSHWHVAFTLPDDPRTMVAALTTSGHRVALVMTGTGSATITPVAAIWATRDGGLWAKLAGVPFDTIDSMAATSDGTLFVAAGDGTLFESTDWSRFTKVDTAPSVHNLQPDGPKVTAQGTGADPTVITITGDGTVKPWPTPLR